MHFTKQALCFQAGRHQNVYPKTSFRKTFKHFLVSLFMSLDKFLPSNVCFIRKTRDSFHHNTSLAKTVHGIILSRKKCVGVIGIQ